MFNNRKFINELIKENEKLHIDIESKENTVCNVLEANKELSQHNNFLENKIRELNIKLSRSEGRLNNLDNYIKMTTGMSILDREDRD